MGDFVGTSCPMVGHLPQNVKCPGSGERGDEQTMNGCAVVGKMPAI